MSEQSVVGVYDSLSKAEDAVRALDERGFPMAQVLLVAEEPDAERGVHSIAADAWGGEIQGIPAGWGRFARHLLKYDEEMKKGKHLLIARGSAEEVAKARDILEHTKTHELTVHAEASI